MLSMYFRQYLPLENGAALYVHNLASPSFVLSLVEIGPVVLEKKIEM